MYGLELLDSLRFRGAVRSWGL